MTKNIAYDVYKAALYIINTEDFDVMIAPNSDGKNVFKLIDNEEANLGGIESEEFTDMAMIFDRLEMYHQDYFFNEFKEKTNPDILSGKQPANISNGKPLDIYDTLAAACWFIKNGYEMLKLITPEVVLAFESNYMRPIVSYDDDICGDKALHCVVLTTLVNLLLESLSAIRVVEYNNNLYYTDYGEADCWNSQKDFYDTVRSLCDEIKQEKIPNVHCVPYHVSGSYLAYLHLLLIQRQQILDDLEDLGKTGHYYDEYAFAYLGMFDKLNQFKDNFIRIKAIEWSLDDCSDETNHPDLPEKVIIDEDSFYQLYPDVDLKNHDITFDCIAEYLLNTYGYCVKSFRLHK